MELDELKRRLQQFLTDGLVLVVGSGLSCAEGIPGMGRLAEHLCSTIGVGLSQGDSKKWQKLSQLIKLDGLEPALLKCPPGPTLEAEIVRQTAALIATHEQIVIEEVFSGTRVLRFTELIQHLLKPSSGVQIVTTNYDRLIEVAVEESGLAVDTMFVGRFAGRFDERESKLSFCREVVLKKGTISYKYADRAIIYKPHGSLDWYLRKDKPVQYAGNLENGTRLIITPGRNKFRNGYESPFDYHRSKANEAMERAARFLIIGYGFNDDHLETHLRPAIRAGKPTLLLTRSLTPTAAEIAISSSNVIAVERSENDGVEGTRAIVNSKSITYTGINLWDLRAFITAVL